LAQIKGGTPTQTDWSQTTATADRLALSQVVFTIPEVASVGHTRQSAEAANLRFRAVTAPVATTGSTLHFEGYEPGWAQWIVEEGSNKLIGATICGHDCAELIHPSTVGIVGGMTLDQLSHAVSCFPTMSEVYQNLLDASGM
jgi:pyruvate/2-oxoglutarate dehydrogenase complex dihydrolipoamide dehydrogenase (E3) component